MIPFLSRIGTRNCLLLVIIPMIAVAVTLKIVFHFIPPPRPSMLPKASGLIETTSVTEAQPHTVMPIVLPSDLLGAEVYAVGTYVEGASVLPVGSVVIDLVKNDYRFVEIIERPDTTRDDVTRTYVTNSEQDVTLGDITGTLLGLQTRNISCVEPNAKWELPGFCEIPQLLVFESRGVTYTLGADGTHASVGELISLAKSIIAE